MSFEDLQEHGVLLPEEEWGTHSLETTVPQGPLALLFAVGVGALVAVYLGGGGLTTWVATAVFLAALYGITWICDRAVVRQCRRVRRERRERRETETGQEPGRTAGDRHGDQGTSDG